MSLDAYRFLTALDARDSGARLRVGQATVRSVEADSVFGTASGRAWIVPALGEWPNDVVPANYLGEYPPRPGGAAWYVTDGVDRIVLGMVAPEGPPFAQVSLAAATALVTVTLTDITLATINHDPWNMATGTGLRMPVSGLYQLQANAVFAANATGYRGLTIAKNGTTVVTMRHQTNVNTDHRPVVTFPVQSLAAGDVITVQAIQQSGANLNLNELSLTALFVGRRRASGTSSELLTYGGFPTGQINDGISWASSGSATYSIVGGADAFSGDYAAQGVHTAGTVSSTLTSEEVLQVVPRQKLRVSARVKTSAALAGTSTNAVQLWLVCAADGKPSDAGNDPVYTFAAPRSTTTGYTLVSDDLTIPTGCYVAQVALVTYTTTGVTVFWDDVSAVELIN